MASRGIASLCAWVRRLGLAALVLAFPAAASANVISYNATFGPADIAEFDPDGTPIQVQLPKFDTSVYDASQLIGIELTLATEGTASIEVRNSRPTARTSTSQSVDILVTMAGPLSLTISNVLSAISSSSVVVPGSSAINVSGLPVSDAATGIVASADWSAYEGAGPLTLTLLVTNDGGSYTGTGGAGALTYGGDATLSGTITIEYELVPEPLSVALFGVALLGTAAVRRRVAPRV